jgi:hypothetical protein
LPLAQAGYNVLSAQPNPNGGSYPNPLETPYSVRRNNVADTWAKSQFVQLTSGIGLPQSKYQIQTWIDTILIDFFQVSYTWGGTNSPPFTAGSFDARSFFGFTIGTQTSVVWAQESGGVGPGGLQQPAVAVQHALAKFDVHFPLGGVQYTVTNPISSPFLPDAPYYVFNSSSNSPSGKSPALAPARESPLAAGIAAGQVFQSGSALEIIDHTANDIVQTLFNFDSTVELQSNGLYTYTYSVSNHSTNAVDVSWSALGPNTLHLDAAGGNDSYALIFESALAPAENTIGGNLLFQDQLSRTALFGGPITQFEPVPIPAAAWLLGSALGLMWFRLENSSSQRKAVS